MGIAHHRLAWLGLNQDGFFDRALAIWRYGASRVALILGTSTSSMGETERAYGELVADGRFNAEQRGRRVHAANALTEFVQTALGVSGPSMTISTACSSSAKVFASAERLLRADLADAAIVGGVDTLCGSVLYGFNSLELVSREPCRPFDAARSGLSLGEAAGFALLERTAMDTTAPRLVGYGESADAHHMSAPHPQGLGAELALTDALASAGLAASESTTSICTARRAGQRRVEGADRAHVPGHDAGEFDQRTDTRSARPVSSKRYRCWRSSGHRARHAQYARRSACGPQIRSTIANAVRVALSNSFGFGGNNCCLAFAAGGA